MVNVNETIKSSGAVSAKTSELIRKYGKNIIGHARNATGEASQKIGDATGNIASDLWKHTGAVLGHAWLASGKVLFPAWKTTGDVAGDVWGATKNISGELFELGNHMGDKAWDHVTEEKNIVPYGIAAAVASTAGLLLGYQMLTAKSRAKKRKKAHRHQQKKALHQAKVKIAQLEATQKTKDAQLDQLLKQSSRKIIPLQEDINQQATASEV